MADSIMPQEISRWMRQRSWGDHHLQWHLVRLWDIAAQDARDWMENQGWARETIQEGGRGNGLAFLAMHRVMIRDLTANFPQHASLFGGWQEPPIDPNDPSNPVPGAAAAPFDPDMLQARARLANQIQEFSSDDALGLYIETRLRPAPGQPSRRSGDATTGLHNYLHNRFSDENSPVNMGDPSVNIENQMFWRLHGWIDSRWSAFRQSHNLPENQPEYAQALFEASQHMSEAHPHGPHVNRSPAEEREGRERSERLIVPEKIKASILETLRRRAEP